MARCSSINRRCPPAARSEETSAPHVRGRARELREDGHRRRNRLEQGGEPQAPKQDDRNDAGARARHENEASSAAAARRTPPGRKSFGTAPRMSSALDSTTTAKATVTNRSGSNAAPPFGRRVGRRSRASFARSRPCRAHVRRLLSREAAMGEGNGLDAPQGWRTSHVRPIVPMLMADAPSGRLPSHEARSKAHQPRLRGTPAGAF